MPGRPGSMTQTLSKQSRPLFCFNSSNEKKKYIYIKHMWARDRLWVSIRVWRTVHSMVWLCGVWFHEVHSHIVDLGSGATVLPDRRWPQSACCNCCIFGEEHERQWVEGAYVIYMHYIYIYVCVCVYSKTSLNRPTMWPSLNGPFREMVSLAS